MAIAASDCRTDPPAAIGIEEENLTVCVLFARHPRRSIGWHEACISRRQPKAIRENGPLDSLLDPPPTDVPQEAALEKSCRRQMGLVALSQYAARLAGF